MASISQIQIGNTTYDLYDATMRSAYTATRTDTSVSLMVGSDGVNHGIWSDSLQKWLLYANSTNENVYLNNMNFTDATTVKQSLGIGTYYSASSKKQITTTSGIDTLTDGASLTLPAGSYIITGSWEFPASSDSGVRVCQAAFRVTSSLIAGSRHRIVEAANNFATVQATIAYSLNNTATMYIVGSSSKATNAPSNNNTFIEAVKIA